jgi:UDP-glucose 4-epimerase
MLAERPALVYNLGHGAGYPAMEVIDMARPVAGHSFPAAPHAPERFRADV